MKVGFHAQEQVGRYVYHCHILVHEDKGMMARVEVIDVGGRRASLREIPTVLATSSAPVAGGRTKPVGPICTTASSGR